MRTRQGAHCLAEVLRAAMIPVPSNGALLGFINAVYLFVGHGASNRRALGCDFTSGSQTSFPELLGGDDLKMSARGMPSQKQQKVLDQFKAPGCRVLVATSAAEEGMDIPCCEFVLRFCPATTGIQRVQSKGRARKSGSVYVSLVQCAGVNSSGLNSHREFQFDKNSIHQEQIMKKVLSGF